MLILNEIEQYLALMQREAERCSRRPQHTASGTRKTDVFACCFPCVLQRGHGRGFGLLRRRAVEAIKAGRLRLPALCASQLTRKTCALIDTRRRTFICLEWDPQVWWWLSDMSEAESRDLGTRHYVSHPRTTYPPCDWGCSASGTRLLGPLCM